MINFSEKGDSCLVNSKRAVKSILTRTRLEWNENGDIAGVGARILLSNLKEKKLDFVSMLQRRCMVAVPEPNQQWHYFMQHGIFIWLYRYLDRQVGDAEGCREDNRRPNGNRLYVLGETA